MEALTITTMLLGTSLEARVLPNDEPRIEAKDLGALLEYDRARDARKLVERMVNEGRLSGRDVSATVARSKQGRSEEQLWLSERAVLLVAASSETERAWQVRTALVDFFLTFRRGGGSGDGAVLAEVRALRAEVRELREVQARPRPRRQASMQTALDFENASAPAPAPHPDEPVLAIVARVLSSGEKTAREIVALAGAEIDAAAGRHMDAVALGRLLGRLRLAGHIKKRRVHDNVAAWSVVT